MVSVPSPCHFGSRRNSLSVTRHSITPPIAAAKICPSGENDTLRLQLVCSFSMRDSHLSVQTLGFVP
jgi:hypothetical protein